MNEPDGVKEKKQKKIVTETGNPTITTEYAGNYIYEGSALQFFNHAEGYVEPDGSNAYNYIYQYKDHLGNIRLSYTDADGNGSINASTEIVEENNYYPFGLKHKGYNSNITSTNLALKNKYNGKEFEESLGLNMYEMDLRQYDPAIARWTSIDPITHHSMSTYTAFDNNPIFWSDPSGADAEQRKFRWRDGKRWYERIWNGIKRLFKKKYKKNKKKRKKRKKRKSSGDGGSTTYVRKERRSRVTQLSFNTQQVTVVINGNNDVRDLPDLRPRVPIFPTAQEISGDLLKIGGGDITSVGTVKRIKSIDFNNEAVLQILNTIVNTLNSDSNLILEMNYISPSITFPQGDVRSMRARRSVNEINTNRHNILVRFLRSKGIDEGRIRMIQNGNGYQTFQFLQKN